MWQVQPLNHPTLVSAIVIFLNAEAFLQEAIDSILAQSYPNWELLLVDDGSSDNSTAIAQQLAAQRPEQVRYLEHPGHINCGMSASRNLGIRHSRGHYIAFLDADDVWLPEKLEEQIAILNVHPEVGMLYGRTQYWYSWTGTQADVERDFTPAVGVSTGVPLTASTLLPLFVRGRVAVPCTCSLMLRRSTITTVGGFDEAFTGEHKLYEDQAFYVKVNLVSPIIAAPNVWDRYRQHPDSITALSSKAGRDLAHRRYFLSWLEHYLTKQRIEDASLWYALRREQWRIQSPQWVPSNTRVQHGVRWLKKWLLRFEERLLPSVVSRHLWGGVV